jgi:hypothetical protein
MGDTMIRFGKVTDRSVNGVKSCDVMAPCWLSCAAS